MGQAWISGALELSFWSYSLGSTSLQVGGRALGVVKTLIFFAVPHEFVRVDML